MDEDEKSLEVVVTDDQLNLAIGRKGQNVKLAAKLLGWKIDIFTESRFREANVSKKFLEQLASVAEIHVDNIIAAGFDTMEQLAEAEDAAIDAIYGMTPSKRDDLRAALKLMGAFDKPEEAPGEAASDEDVVASPADADVNVDADGDGDAAESQEEAAPLTAPETTQTDAPAETPKTSDEA